MRAIVGVLLIGIASLGSMVFARCSTTPSTNGPSSPTLVPVATGEAVFVNSQGTTPSTNNPSSPALVPAMSGEAAFVNSQSTKYVRFCLRGTHSCVGHPPADITVQQIELFGASGRWGSDEVGVPAHLIKRVTVPVAPSRLWDVNPREWARDKLGWDGTPEYTLLLRYTYDLSENGHVSSGQTAERLWLIGSIRPSGFVNFSPPSPPSGSPTPTQGGDTIGNVHATGTFFGAQGMALYDISFDITPPPMYRPHDLNVYAEPTSTGAMPVGFPTNTGDLVTIPPISLPGDATSATITGLRGTYVSGTDMYYFRIVVTYTASGMQPVTEFHDGTFTAINGQPAGGLIPLN
jgi:hypothetical protein